MGAAHVGLTLHIAGCQTTHFSQGESNCASTFLVREVRLIALTAALQRLPYLALDCHTARASAFALAGFCNVTEAEHCEAAFRAHLWWALFRKAKPSAPARVAVANNALALAA